MFSIQPKYHPSLRESIVFFILTIGLISYFIIGLKTDPHIPILIAVLLTVAYGLIRNISFQDLESGMIAGAKSGMAAIFLFLLIGILISSWIVSGTIPTLMNTGFAVIGGTWFYAIVFAVTAIIGVSLGSSLTTTATIGVAFIGMTDAVDASAAITAGAIVSGAFFSDKMSPLSDTTNLASTVVQVDLFTHIKHMTLTTIPAFVISFVLFAILSPNEAMTVGDLDAYRSSLAETGLMHWTSWIPLILLFLAAVSRIPAFVAIALSSASAVILGGITSGIAWTDIWDILFSGYTAETGFAPVDELLSKGGLESMLVTVSLVILALGFGGLLFVTGIVPTILLAFQKKLQKVRTIITATAATALGVNVLIGEQYLSVMLTGETFKSVYQQADLSPKVLARTLEDAGTVINPLVPWSVCGVFIADVLGVPVLTYLPFAFFCLLSPLITLFFGGRALKT